MHETHVMPPSPLADVVPVPPLRHGERLTRDEFERRYSAMPHLHKAELINGVVYMPSPVRSSLHGRPHGHLHTWLGVYEAATPGVQGNIDTTVRLDLGNKPQPDSILFIDPARGGQVRIAARTTMSSAVPNSPPRFPLAASPSISVRNCSPTSVTRCASTSSGACRTGRSIGLCSGAAFMSD